MAAIWGEWAAVLEPAELVPAIWGESVWKLAVPGPHAQPPRGLGTL